MSLEQKRIERLYKLLSQTKNPDTAAALRWAIFELERAFPHAWYGSRFKSHQKATSRTAAERSL